MKKITCLRHGDIGQCGKYIGSTDYTLSSEGQRQILQAKESIKKLHPDLIYTSPLKRCIRSCSLLGLSAHAVVKEEIREVDFGRWEGLSFAEIASTAGELVQKWKEDEEAFAFPGGESISSFRGRVQQFSNHLYEVNADSILVVSHGGVIRHLLCFLLKIQIDKHIVFKLDYGKTATLDFHREGGVLTSLND